MAPDKGGGRSVFIGNIPYGVSEEQIIDTFGRVGQVNNFRLVHDKETGRPKGFGFLEYADPDAAASAVRNLNEHEIMGRKLRVDWSNNPGGSGGGSGGNAMGGMDEGFEPQMPDGNASVLPPLPPGTELPPGLTCPDAISKTLSAIPAPQLLDIISQMKGLVMDNPTQATALFQQMPQLAYAIFQALLLLGLVDMHMLGNIVQATSAPQGYPPAQQMPPAMPPAPPAQYNPTPQPNYAAYAPQFQAQHAPTPPVQQPMYQPPPPPQQAPPAMPNQQDLIRQVMSMTMDQINQLDPAARDQIIALRAQLGAPVS